VFTARYALSPYIKHIGFVFKGLRRQEVERRGAMESGLPYACEAQGGLRDKYFHMQFVLHIKHLQSALQDQAASSV
jgi:hypothetical protein